MLELVRAHHPLGGFPWGLLALSQHDAGPLLPLARVVGGFGLAAVIVAVNLAVAFWLRALCVERPGPPGGGDWAALAGLPLLVVGLLGARLVVPAGPGAVGAGPWTWSWSRPACAAGTGWPRARPPSRSSPTTSGAPRPSPSPPATRPTWSSGARGRPTPTR